MHVYLYAIIIIMSTTLHSATLLFSLNAGTCHANPVFIRNVIFKERYYPYPQFEVNTMYYYYSRQGKNTTHLWLCYMKRLQHLNSIIFLHL